MMEKLLTDYIGNINPMIILVAFVMIIFVCWIIFKNRKVISEFFNDLYNRKKNREDFTQKSSQTIFLHYYEKSYS